MSLLDSTPGRIDPALALALDRIGERRDSDGPVGAHGVPPRLLEAMRYALLSPGKRLRPALVFGSARAVGASARDVLPPACAVEMVHAYSLVHDDLPAMDDDDLRRGHPTVHRAFNEATAILVGDALLTEAFSLLADDARFANRKPPRSRARAAAVVELSRAIGAAGMVGGQEDDIAAELAHAPAIEADVRSIHLRKTGRLIQAASALGAIWVGAAAADVERLRRFGVDLGLAFQLVDDALDHDGLAPLLGDHAVRAEARALTERALGHLAPLGRAARPLARLAELITERVA